MKSEVSQNEANSIIRKHVYASMGVSMSPIPFTDIILANTFQLRMLRKLARLYGESFASLSDLKSISSVLKYFVSFIDDAAIVIFSRTSLSTMSSRLVLSAAKFIPGIGQTVGVVTLPVLTGATTYAIGKVYNKHFATGGSFLTFDPEKAKKYYAKMFEEGKKLSQEYKNKKIEEP